MSICLLSVQMNENLYPQMLKYPLRCLYLGIKSLPELKMVKDAAHTLTRSALIHIVRYF